MIAEASREAKYYMLAKKQKKKKQKKNQKKRRKKKRPPRGALRDGSKNIFFRTDVTRNRAAIEAKKIRFLSSRVKKKEREKKKKKRKKRRKKENEKKKQEKCRKTRKEASKGGTRLEEHGIAQEQLGCVEPVTLPERNTCCRIRFDVATSF